MDIFIKYMLVPVCMCVCVLNLAILAKTTQKDKLITTYKQFGGEKHIVDLE